MAKRLKECVCKMIFRLPLTCFSRKAMFSMKQSAYKESGVDIEAGDALVENIKPMAKSTHRSGMMGGLGGFGSLFDVKAAGYTDPVIVSSTDGVGTKIRVAIDCKHS